MVTCLQTTQHKTDQQTHGICKSDFRQILQFTSDCIAPKVYCENVQHGPACIAFLCSSPLPFFSGCMRPYIAKTWVLFQTTTYIRKIFWYIVTTYLWAGPPCTYSPNLSSKSYHLTPKQPSNSLPFLHYKLVRKEHKNGGNFFYIPSYTSTSTLISERVYCDQFVIEEWQTISRLFGV